MLQARCLIYVRDDYQCNLTEGMEMEKMVQRVRYSEPGVMEDHTVTVAFM